MVWPYGVRCEMVGEVIVWVTSNSIALGEWSMLSRSPRGVRGGVVAVTGNPGGSW